MCNTWSTPFFICVQSTSSQQTRFFICLERYSGDTQLDKANETAKTFVAAQLTEISTNDHQLHWHLLPTTLNPADHGTRSLEPRDTNEKGLTHPTFLKQPRQLRQDNSSHAKTVVATAAKKNQA